MFSLASGPSAARWLETAGASTSDHSRQQPALPGRTFTTLHSLSSFSCRLTARTQHAAKHRLVCHGYKHKLKRSDFLDDAWPEKIPENSIDWSAFWSGQEFLEIEEDMDNTEGLTGEEEEVLALQRESVDQSAHDMVRGRWSDFEKRRDYVRPEPIPLRKQYFPDIPKPEPKSKYYENFNELDLRAIVEKRRMRERSNVLWKQRMDAAGTTRYLNLTPKTDYRLQRHGEEPRDWTHEEMMNFITNHGQNADPFKIKIGVNDPLGRLDYFEQGVEWIDETEDFLAKRGHWQEDVAELQHDPDISTLDSTFANFDEAGGEAEMDAPESQESVPLAADDEDTGLGDAEDGSLGGYF